MKHLGLSGAGFAIPGIAGAAYELIQRGYKPDIISGVSSGAILGFILTYSNDPLSVIENNITNFTAKDVFDTPPLNNKGRLTFMGIFNLITKGYFSTKGALEKTLMKYVTEEEFYCKQNNFNTPDFYVLCVDLIKGKRIVKNLRDLNYQEAVSTVVASASIPLFTKPLKTDENLLVDGGVRNHILTPWILENFNITETWSVYSRPKDFFKEVQLNDVSSSIEVLIRVVEIMQFELSKSDEQISELLCTKKGLTNNCIYLDRILKNVYQEDRVLAKKLYELGKSLVKEKNPEF